MARMRKNPILKRKFEHLFWMLYNRTHEPDANEAPYKAFKTWNLIPTYQGEGCNYPNNEWKIFVSKPIIRANITHINQVFSFSRGKPSPESFSEFLEINDQIASITSDHNRQYGLLITFKSLGEWIQEVRKFNIEKISELTKDFDEPIKNRILKALYSKKWDFLRVTDFGNNSAGTDMREREKFLIVYGNWFSGEYNRFNGYLFPDASNNYRLSVIPDAKEEIKKDLQILLMREYLEYPLRSRRKIQTYCIVDYFKEKDKTLLNTNTEILRDYNLEIVFV